jgi:3-oxoadipate enol-lactonase
MRLLKVRDAAIHYRAIGIGEGKPVIAFINSLGTDFRIWEPVMAALGDGYAYVLHDKRGHGLSVGGLIAQAIHAKRADLVRALVLSNTASKIGSPNMWNDRIAAILKDGLGGMVDPIMERWFTPSFRLPDNAVYAGCRNMLVRQPVEGYCGTCAAIRDADYTDAATKIVVPTLCVVGDQDGSTPPALVRSLAGLVPGSSFAVIEGCGHIPCIEQPAAYAAAVGAFLKTLPES